MMNRDVVDQFFDEFKECFRLLIRETVAEELEPAATARAAAVPASLVVGETRRQVAEQILLSNKHYPTRAGAAAYLGVSERSTKEWSARPADQNPFPEVRAGTDPRYRRAAIDAWASGRANSCAL